MEVNRFFILLIALLVVSCNPKGNVNTEELTSQENLVDTLVKIQTDVKMVYIPGGEYKPFYGSEKVNVTVAPFLIDERPVTNQEFLEFVIANPQWRKSNIKKVYSDSSYLRDWVSDTELPKGVNPDAPICFVSWFAAKAFAESVGKRMPTLDEWEFVAMADAEVPNAREKKSYSDNIVDLYLQKDRQFNAVKQSPPNYYGVYNVFDLIWEWTDDFNSIMTTGDSRNGEFNDKNLFCAGGATAATDVLNYAAFMRFALRTSIKANFTIANLGFRCAKDTIVETNIK